MNHLDKLNGSHWNPGNDSVIRLGPLNVKLSARCERRDHHVMRGDEPRSADWKGSPEKAFAHKSESVPSGRPGKDWLRDFLAESDGRLCVSSTHHAVFAECSRPLRAANAARCVACHGVRSHAVPVALVGECSIPVV